MLFILKYAADFMI